MTSPPVRARFVCEANTPDATMIYVADERRATRANWS